MDLGDRVSNEIRMGFRKGHMSRLVASTVRAISRTSGSHNGFKWSHFSQIIVTEWVLMAQSRTTVLKVSL